LPSAREIADILQTFAQGASSQCRHMTGAVTSLALTTKSLGVSLAFNSPATSGGIAMWASAQAISQVRQPTHFSVSANMKEFNLSSCNVPPSRTEVPPVSR
jgi:hypothetical protein